MVRTTTSVICLLLLSACGFVRNAPENNATQFIRTLIVDPGNVGNLRNFADVTAGQDPTMVVHGLSTDVAVSYLQTREHQGEKQDFTVDSVRLEGSSVQIVTIRVARAGSRSSGAVAFRVTLKDVPGRGWLVTAVSAE